MIIAGENRTAQRLNRFWRFLVRADRPPSLRNRLIILNLMVLVVMLVVLGVVVYELVVQRLMTDLDERLQVQARELQVSTHLWESSGNSFDNAFFNEAVQGNAVDEFSANQIYVKLLDKTTGRTLVRSPNLDRERLVANPADFQAALRGESVLSTQRDGDNEQVRLLTFPLMTQDRKIIAVAQVSQALQPVEDVKDVLITVLTLRCLFAGVLAYGLGYFLTSHELRPLQTVVNMMHNLNAQQLMQRLKPPRPLTAEVQLLTQTFNQMLERLEASFALQRAFVADVSHELRTPLTAIRGQIDVVLLDPELKPEIRSDIQQVRAELGRLSRLVANLLTNARAETGILPAPGQNGLQRVELDALLVEITRQARFLNEQVTLELGQLEQLRVPGEADLLKQVILNLVDNALAYTPPGGKVCLELQHSSQVDRKRPGEWAVISVNDTGPGIAHDDLPHIFERHYRASAGARSRTGSGLGLYIARLIAEAHQGYIEACSEPGKGSSFKVYLPIII